MIPLLSEYDDFPNPRDGINHHDGLICVTQKITPKQILAAYRQGIFPWYEDGQFYYWFSLAPRAILLPECLHLSRSLKKSMKNQSYHITMNHDFAAVIAACASVPRSGQGGSWISSHFQNAYTELHHLGHAHSFEYWNQNNELMGGLYGVQIGSVFYGESMFSRQSDASKITFAHAVPFLADLGIQLIDCQQDTAYLRQFGSQTMPFDEFQAALRRLNKIPLKNNLLSSQLIAHQPS